MKVNKGYNNYKNYDKYLKASQNRETPKTDANINKEKNIDKEKNIKVQISDTSKKLIQSLNLEKDQEKNKKVESIKKSILEGQYRVDDKTIAKNIMGKIGIQKGEKLK